MQTGIIRDARFLEHDMGSAHIESPNRLDAIYRMIDRKVDFPFLDISPRPASESEILYIHTPEYYRRVRGTAGKPHVPLDPDTSTSARSFETSLLAAGGVLAAADAIVEGRVRNAIAFIRPPGHHAEIDRARGFCIFNNIAITAEHLIRLRGMKRILIVDWDIHHGNGTQNQFYERSDVIYVSIHQSPFFPGTGYWSETGRGSGKGYTINVPLSPGKTDADYLFIMKKLLAPIALQFSPDFILVSAGFDIHFSDPLGGMEVTTEGIGAITRELVDLARKTCDDRLLIALEGGYNLQAIQDGSLEVLRQLHGSGRATTFSAEASPEALRELAPVFEMHNTHWKI